MTPISRCTTTTSRASGSCCSTIWNKGLIYQGYKVVPYDPRIGATLSSHEVALGYREVEDPSRLRAVRAWPASRARLSSSGRRLRGRCRRICCSPCIPTSSTHGCERGDETLILARNRSLAAVFSDEGYEIVRSALGTELDGMRYERLFDYLPVSGDICRVRPAEFVTTEDGTGIVHVAPAYGEDDLKLGQRHGLARRARRRGGRLFPRRRCAGRRQVLQGRRSRSSAILRERGLLFRARSILHNYPFGWRTGDPLIYYAKNAWYIRTTRVSRTHGRAQHEHQLGARAHPGRALRQLAREQHRLGALARAFLGHAVAAVDGR